MKKMQKFLSLILALSMMLSMTAFSANAKQVIDGNDWYGDEVSVDVTAGTEGYNYMALFRQPIHGYEFAGHFIGDGEGAQTFVVIDTAKHDGTTWTPNGMFELGKSNYDVLYCCDVETMIKDGTYYKRVNLEDSEYYNAEQAKKIRAIVSNSSPYVSLKDMKAALKEAGFQYAEKLTRSEIISAVQAAIWASANNMTADDFRYVKTYNVGDNLQWGYPVHDISDEAGYEVSGNRTFAEYPEVGERHDALVDYLLALPGVEAEEKQIVITKLDIVHSKIDNTENQYLVSLGVELNYGADADDNVKIYTYINGELIADVEVGSSNRYTLSFNATENSDIKVVVSGTQNLEKGVYFYAPKPADVDGDGIATGREVSQNLVGVSMGETPVHAEAEVTLRNGTLEADKEAENKGNDKFEVSIEVPGGDAAELSKTNYTDVVITDYMSKWVILDTTSIYIKNDTTGEIIWTIKDGWKSDTDRPTTKTPVIVDVVESNKYIADDGVTEEINKNGVLYKLTWNVKDDCLLRTDNYSLHYVVTVDTAEEGFVPGVEYPANGHTYVEYEEDGHNDIDVPDVTVPAYTVTYLNGNVTLQKTYPLVTGDEIPDCEDPDEYTDGDDLYIFSGWKLVSGTEGADGTVGTTDLVYEAVYTLSDDVIIDDGDTPLDPTPNVPKTGDNEDLALAMFGMLLSLAAIAVVLKNKKFFA